MLLIKPQMENSKRWLTSNGFPWTILVILLTVSTGFWYYSESVFINLSLDRFHSRVENQKNQIVEHINDYKLVLQNIASLLDANEIIANINWQRYISTLKQEIELAGIQSMGFIAVDISGQPVVGDSIADTYPELLSSLIQAQISAKMALIPSAHIYGNEKQDKSDYLFVFPIYRNHTIPTVVDVRRKSVVGFVFLTFQVKAFMQGLSPDMDPELDIELFAGAAEPKHLLFFSRRIAAPPRYASRKELVIGGQIWTIYFLSKPEFEASALNHMPIMIHYAGLTMSLLVFFLLFLNIERQRTIQALKIKSEQSHIDVN